MELEAADISAGLEVATFWGVAIGPLRALPISVAKYDELLVHEP